MLRFCLVLFIINLFAKVLLLYSAMTVAVVVSSKDTKADSADENSKQESSSNNVGMSDEGNITPAPHRYHSRVNDQGIDMPKTPETPGVSGLVSPGYNPHMNMSYSP